MTKPKREECRYISLLSLQKHCALQKKRGGERNIKGTIDALLGCKRSWKSNLVLFCGFRLFAECIFEMLLCVDVRLLSFEVKCACVLVGFRCVWAVRVPVWPRVEERPPVAWRLERNVPPEESLQSHRVTSSRQECWGQARRTLWHPPFSSTALPYTLSFLSYTISFSSQTQ